MSNQKDSGLFPRRTISFWQSRSVGLDLVSGLVQVGEHDGKRVAKVFSDKPGAKSTAGRPVEPRSRRRRIEWAHATTNASAALARLTLSSSGQVAKDHQKTLTAVRAVISKYPLSAALKQIEAWRSGDDTWLSVLPPQIGLSIEQANELHADLEALEPSAGILGKKLNAA